VGIARIVCASSLVGVVSGTALVGCEPGNGSSSPHAESARDRTNEASERSPEETMREKMVSEQLERRDIDDPRVLAAMRKVPRHLFVPEDMRARAYSDRALPIGYDVTISQPYIVALMTQLASVKPGDRVLEVGTGSGYQSAVLAELGAEVYSLEIIEPLATAAAAVLEQLGYGAVHVRHADGYAGWPEHAPYQAIVVTAAPPRIPAPLREQLAIGGRLVVPVGPPWQQELLVVTRTEDGYSQRSVIPVAFVPMVGEAQGAD
jgi:protein-L-isoaspartate(D-aspartate) O-methyltransferase